MNGQAIPGGDFGTTSFDFYEGIRILIPGAVAVGLTESILNSVPTFADFSLLPGVLGGVLLSLSAGLVLYFLDVPIKSAFYNYRQPTDLLAKRTQRVEREVRPGFFLIFDTEMPPIIRARALYMGSMFRIGFEGILLLGIAQYGIWIYSAVCRCPEPDSDLSPYQIGVSALLALLVVRLMATAVRQARREASAERQDLNRKMILAKLPWALASPFRELGVLWTTILILGTGGILVSMGLGEGTQLRLLVGTSSAALIAVEWTVLFLWGVTLLPTSRPSPVGALTSMLLYVLSSGGFMIVLEKTPGSGGLVGRTGLGWITASLLGGVLIAGRGHERRLEGAYASQREWLEVHKTSSDS